MATHIVSERWKHLWALFFCTIVGNVGHLYLCQWATEVEIESSSVTHWQSLFKWLFCSCKDSIH